MENGGMVELPVPTLGVFDEGDAGVPAPAPAPVPNGFTKTLLRLLLDGTPAPAGRGLTPARPRGVGVYSDATSEVSPTSTASSNG